ncbi:solute carrier family 35 member G1-like [Apostichopus japonicus]|uniref:solute carrier family 35 member G1-like n=1 Tax=Stichopus japonicus TaxID=307972 RepID=UPI003AB56CB5
MKQCALDRIVGISSAIAAAFSFSAENILLARFSCQPHRYFTITVSAFALTLCVSILTLCRRPTFNLGLRTLPVLAFGFTAAIGHTLLVLAVFNLGPGDGILIFYTEPVFVIIFSAIFLQNAFRWTDPLFVGSAIAAVFVLSTNIFNRRQEEEKGDTELIIPQSIFGVICGLFSALASAASIVIARKLSENEIDYSVMITSYAIQYLIVSLLPTTLSKSWGILGNTRDVLVMVLTGISLSGGLAFEFFAVTKENPSVVTTILLSEVIITYFGEHLLLEKQLSWQICVASLLIIMTCLGIIITHSEENEGNKDEDSSLLENSHSRCREKSLLSRICACAVETPKSEQT